MILVHHRHRPVPIIIENRPPSDLERTFNFMSVLKGHKTVKNGYRIKRTLEVAEGTLDVRWRCSKERRRDGYENW